MSDLQLYCTRCGRRIFSSRTIRKCYPIAVALVASAALMCAGVASAATPKSPKCPAGDFVYMGCHAPPSMKSLGHTYKAGIQDALNKGQYEYSVGLVRGSHVDGNGTCEWVALSKHGGAAGCWVTVSEPGGDVYQISAQFTDHDATWVWPKTVSIQPASDPPPYAPVNAPLALGRAGLWRRLWR